METEKKNEVNINQIEDLKSKKVNKESKMPKEAIQTSFCTASILLRNYSKHMLLQSLSNC